MFTISRNRPITRRQLVRTFGPSPAGVRHVAPALVGGRVGACIESLEDRTLLSWPDAPFSGPHFKNTLYVNQLGDAVVNNQVLRSTSDFNTYAVYFDDIGPATYETTGPAHTQMAYYPGDGQPRQTSDGVANNGQAMIQVPTEVNKTILYLNVRLSDQAGSGVYNMVVHGVPQEHIGALDPHPSTNANSRLAEISNPNDTDFYSFRATRAGNWGVGVTPVTDLDATINVFDPAGNPVGGTFTTPINRGGPGKEETWTVQNLTQGDQFVFRVDSAGQGTGWYNVRVFRMPAVVVQATRKTASSSASPGQFTIVRTNEPGLEHALKVFYTLTGTATNGVDYRRITGSAIIPVGKNSVNIPVVPLTGAKAGETVTLMLKSNNMYNMKPANSFNSATVTIKGRAAGIGAAVAATVKPAQVFSTTLLTTSTAKIPASLFSATAVWGRADQAVWR